MYIFSLNKFIALNGVLNFFLFENARESIINYGSEHNGSEARTTKLKRKTNNVIRYRWFN